MKTSPNSKLVSLVVIALAGGTACHSSDGGVNFNRIVGQSAFVSAPPAGMTSSGRSFGAVPGADTAAGAGASSGSSTTTSTRTVEETDLRRLDGNRLYYLNGYRGLMVFERPTDVDEARR